MASNRRDLKAYVRYDGSGRVVSDSLVLRVNKPKVGVWSEVRGYQCCNCPQVTVNIDIGNLPFTTGLAYEMFCFDSTSYIYTAILGTFNTVEELADALNKHAPYLGQFSVSVEGSQILLNPEPDICKSFSPCTSGLVAYLYEYDTIPT